jgi:phage terminase small subunit
MPRRCNQRELNFCKHYVACGIAAQAAREAGYKPAYANQASVELLKRPHIQEEIRRLNYFKSTMPKAVFVERLQKLADAATRLVTEIQNAVITR